MPCSYCGVPGCNVDTCPERLEAKFGLPSEYIDDIDGESDEEIPKDGDYRTAAEVRTSP